MPLANIPVFERLTINALSRALKKGWQSFLLTRPLSVSYAMIFAIVGMVILVGIEHASFAPMIFPFAGGFMLIGPVLLCGFFSMADRIQRGETCTFRDVVSGYSRTSREMLSIAFVCTLLFIIWITDAAILYGFVVGRLPVPLQMLVFPAGNVISFLFWSSLLGLVLAFLIFAISAFSIPLLYYRRTSLVRAVHLSVAAVFANLAPCLLWAMTLSVAIIASIFIFPLFLLTFPVLAFASHALYRELFPE